jgi:hypothetical protein
VARGEALGRLQNGTQGVARLPFDRIAISALISGAAPDELFRGCSRLVVAPGASGISAEGYVGLEGAPFPLLNDADLPQQVADWIAALDAARAGEPSGK